MDVRTECGRPLVGLGRDDEFGIIRPDDASQVSQGIASPPDGPDRQLMGSVLRGRSSGSRNVPSISLGSPNVQHLGFRAAALPLACSAPVPPFGTRWSLPSRASPAPPRAVRRAQISPAGSESAQQVTPDSEARSREWTRESESA
jgi:hypothetical protein